MKKLLLVGITIIGIIGNSFAQTTPATLQWERSQNGVASTYNYFVKSRIDGGGNVYSLTNSDEDMVVVKFNSTTQVSQTYRYNNPFNTYDYTKDFEVDGSGNVYMAGFSFINYNYRMTVVKYDASGNMLWDINYLPSNSWVYPTEICANALALDNNGNVYFTGGINDSLVAVKLNSSGLVQWATKIAINGNNFGSGKDIVVDGFGSVFICGKSKNSGGDFDAFTAKLNSSGVVQWTKSIAGFSSEDDEAINLGIDNSSNVYVCSDIADTSATNFTAYLTKYNASGAQQWQKKFYVSGQNYTNAIELGVDNVGNNYLGIHTATGSNVGYATMYKHSSGGSQMYSTVIDDPIEMDNVLTDIYLDQSGNLYSTGNLVSTGKVFYSKLNTSGNSTIYNSFDHSGLSDLYDRVGIVAEPSGFFNLVTTKYAVVNERFNNTGTYQFEGMYAGNGNTFDHAVDVIAQGSNSVYGLGYVTNDISNADAVLSKYDNQGNLLWQNIIDNNLSNDDPFDMAKDSVYNIYLTKAAGILGEVIKFDSIGSSYWTYPSSTKYKRIAVTNGGQAFLAGDATNNSSAYENFSIAKLDASGNLIYANTPVYNSDYGIELQAMAIDSNYRIIAAGKSVYHYSLPDMETAIVVEKYSTSGNLLWHKELTLPDSISNEAYNYDRVTRVLIDNSNDVYIMGTVAMASGFGHTQAFLAKYNGSGNLQYLNFYDGNGAWHEEGADMKFLSGGDVILFSTNPSTFLLKRLDPTNGSVIWETPVYYGYSSGASTVKIDPNDDVFFGGQAVFGNYERDLVIGKMSSGGVLKWVTSKTGVFSGNDYVRNMDITDNGRIYVAASMQNSSGSQSDFSILKFCDINQPNITTTGQTQNICTGSTVTLSANGGVSYLWSDGTTTNDTLIASATGDYFCTILKNDGCSKNTDTVQVQLKLPPTTPQICLVTVDSLSTHNIVVWDKSNVVGATAFNIYREDVTNVYSYIGTVLYDSLSEFHDYTANPNVTTKRYKISAIDTCGQESDFSNYHNTIYIVSNGSGQFSWNPIYTIENTPNPVDNYLLMRDDLSNGNWVQIQSTAGNQNTIVDPAYASFPNASWRVETAWNISCLPTRGAINTSRSNIKSPSSIGLNETTISIDFVLSPNPAGSALLVKTNIREENLFVKIYDALGQELITEKMTGTELNLNIEQLSSGTYFVKLIGSTTQSTKKLIKL